MSRSLNVTDLGWFQSQKITVVISRHANKKSVSILISCRYSLSVSSHVCPLSSYFPYWSLCAHVFVASVCPTNVFTVFVKTLCCCLKAHFFLDLLCQARVWPRASLSTGHWLHHARSCSTHAGKWAPYALALLPLSTVHRHPADGAQNHLCFLSTPCLLFLLLSVSASFSPLSCLAPFLNPRLSLLQSPNNWRVLFQCRLQVAFSATLDWMFFYTPWRSCELFVPLIPHVSWLITWRRHRQGSKPSVLPVQTRGSQLDR